MPSAPTTKASDKVQACKKLTAILQKEYGKSLPRFKQPVLETMLFAVCLEDNPWEKAEAGYDKLLKSYFDLNEIRVSSVGEIEATLSGLKNADWKGLRLRSILRFVFESTYTFDFEKLGRLTLESAQKRLKKIDYLSPFVTQFTLQQVLGSHVVCLDHLSHRAAIHLGIVPPESTIEEAMDFLKAGVKKADAFGFTCLLRKFSTDERFEARVEDEYEQEGEFDVLKVEDRLAVLKAPKKRRKKAVKKTTEKAAAKKSSKKAAPSGSATTKATKKTAAKPAAKKKASDARKKTAPGKVVKKSVRKPAATKNAAAKKKATRKGTAAPKKTAKTRPVPKKKK